MRIDAGACGYIADGSPGRPQTIGTNPHPPASIRTPPHRFQRNHLCKLARPVKIADYCAGFSLNKSDINSYVCH